MNIDEPLSREIAAAHGSDEPIPVIITLQRAEDVESLTSMGVKPRMIYQNISAVAAELTPDQIKQVSTLPQVKSVELDSKAYTLRKQ